MISNVAIKPICENQIDDSVAVFLDAFKEEAFTSSWLDLGNEKIKKTYARAVKMKFKLALDLGNLFLVADEDCRIVGFALLVQPDRKAGFMTVLKHALPHIPYLLFLLPHFMKAIRLIPAIKLPANLPPDHHLLEVLAVSPSFQGRKIGRMLLEEVITAGIANKKTLGIYLLTGDHKNMLIYKKIGFDLLEERIKNGFRSYHMFLRNEA